MQCYSATRKTGINEQTHLSILPWGSFDGAEVCELVGLFTLHHLRAKFENKNTGLYRNDGFAAFQNMGPRTAEKIKKQFVDCLQDLDLKITCKANLKIVNYLDVTFNLSTEKYYIPIQESRQPTYVHKYQF